MRKAIQAGISVMALALHTSSQAAELPRCDVKLRPTSFDMLPLIPPRTEYNPTGFAVLEFTVNPGGNVTDVAAKEWQVKPSDAFMREYIRNSVLAWKYPRRGSACRATQQVSFKLAEDA